MLQNIGKSLLGLLLLLLVQSFDALGQQYSQEVEQFRKKLRKNEAIFKEYRHPQTQDLMVLWGAIAKDSVPYPSSTGVERILFVYLTNLSQGKKTATLATLEAYRDCIPYKPGGKALKATLERYRHAFLGIKDIRIYDVDYPLVITPNIIAFGAPMGMSRNRTHYVDLRRERYLAGSTNTFGSRYEGCTMIGMEGFIYYHIFPLADGRIYGQYVTYDWDMKIKETEPIHLYDWMDGYMNEIDLPDAVRSMSKEELEKTWERVLQEARNKGIEISYSDLDSQEDLAGDQVQNESDAKKPNRNKPGERTVEWATLEWGELPKHHKIYDF